MITSEQLAEAAEAATFATLHYPVLRPNGLDGRSGELDKCYPEIATSIAFLRRCVRTKIPMRCSYGLKHAVENWGHLNGLASYVSNGALIAAAVYLGFAVRPVGDGINAYVGVSRRSERVLRETVRPTT